MLPLFLAVAIAPGSIDRTLPVTSFHAVVLTARATVRVEQAPVSSVVASGDARLVRCVTADVHEGRLVIGWSGRGGAPRHAPGAGTDIVVSRHVDCRREGDPRHLTIRVSGPEVDEVALRDLGTIHVQPMRVRAFTANIYERGDISINGLHADVTRFSIPGIGRIAASGELGRLRIEVAGQGTIDARAAHATGVNVSVAGNANVLANVDGLATGTIDGTGAIALGGHPVCQVRNVGKGRINCPAVS